MKNIKRGAQPRPELRQMLKDQMIITRNEYIKEIDRVWKKAKNDKLNEFLETNDDPINRPRHIIEAENIAIKAPSDRNQFHEKRDADTEINKIIKNKFNDLEEVKKERLKLIFKDQPFVLTRISGMDHIFLRQIIGKGRHS